MSSSFINKNTQKWALLRIIQWIFSTAPVIDEDLTTKLKQFDLPRFAPTARIIKLSRTLTHKKGSNSLLQDKVLLHFSLNKFI